MQRGNFNRVPEGGFPPHISAMFVFKLFIEFIVPYDCAQRIDSCTAARGNNPIAFPNIETKIGKLLECLCWFSRMIEFIAQLFSGHAFCISDFCPIQ